MNEQQLAAVKQALEALQDFADDIRHDNEQDEIGCRVCCDVLSYDNHSENCKAMKSITALQSIIAQHALDKMAEDARTVGLRLDDWDKIGCVNHDCAKCKAQPAPNCTRSHPHENMDAVCELRTEIARLTNENARLKAQPAVQEGRDWSLLEATQESLREHMAEIKRLKAAQPVPVKTYHDGKPWPVAPKPWVGLSEKDKTEIRYLSERDDRDYVMALVETKLKEKNHG
jgi:hypothetical protein